MKPAETKRVYEAACRAKRITPQTDEGATWHRVLRGYEIRDIEAALDAWWADTTQGKDGRPRGAWLPTPAELKPLVEQALRKREARAREPRVLVDMNCGACGLWWSVTALPGAMVEIRCGKCGKKLQEQARAA